MPIHHGSWRNEDERPSPSGPQPPQDYPEQFVYGRKSTARSLGVENQELLTQSKVFENKILPGHKSSANPPEKMSEQRDHGKNLTGIQPIQGDPYTIDSANARGLTRDKGYSTRCDPLSIERFARFDHLACLKSALCVSGPSLSIIKEVIPSAITRVVGFQYSFSECSRRFDPALDP